MNAIRIGSTRQSRIATLRRAVTLAITCVALAGALGLAGLGTPSDALAWKPGGHYVLAQRIQHDMEPGVIKSAMGDPANASMSYAWGSYGADVGYGTLGSAVGGWASYADLFHYQKTGSFAKALLQNAIASKHPDQIAYAAGWLTHTCTDMYVHQDVVNPHAGGVFFDNEGTIPLHRNIESWADTVMWEDYYGNHSGTEFNADDFGGKYHRDMPLGLRSTFAATVKQVYEQSPSSSQAGALFGGITHSDATLDGGDFEGLTEKVYLVLSTGWMADEAGLYKNRGESEAGLASAGVTNAEIFAAADKGAAMATWLLNCAQRGDYSAFSDTWNLDVGPGAPDALNSLVVELTTDSDAGDGTDGDVDFWIADKTPNGTEPNQTGWTIDHSSYDDFERNDRDLYFVYNDPSAPRAGIRSPAQVGHLGLYCRNGGLTGAWDPRRLKVWCNGTLVVPNQENIPELNSGKNWWLLPYKYEPEANHLDWSSAVKWPSRPVPKVLGMTQARAAMTLSAATYYKLGSVSSAYSSRPVGQIVSQVPSAYSKPGFGAAVSVRVSKGPEPSSVSTPIARSRMSRTKSYKVYGYLKPRHTAGTYPVRIYKWKKTASGKWKSYGYVRAKASNHSTFTKYSRSMRLSSAGKWRLRAYTPVDSLHLAKWSKGYDYVTVK